MSRLEDISGDREEATGGSAATGVVSNTSLVIHNVNDSVMPVAHVNLILQIEHDFSCDATPPKRARMAHRRLLIPPLRRLSSTTSGLRIVSCCVRTLVVGFSYLASVHS